MQGSYDGALSHTTLKEVKSCGGGLFGLGSKVKVNFGTLCIKPCGHDTDYSFCPITIKLHMQVVDDERRNPIDFGSGGQRSRSTLALCIKPAWHDTDYSCCQITFKLHMQVVDVERRNPIDLGSLGQRSSQLWHFVYKTLWARYPIHFGSWG